jgi:predicted Zn-dependent protease
MNSSFALLAAAIATIVSAKPDPHEMALSYQVYQDILNRHSIVSSGPETKLLAPVAKQLEAVGDPLYGAPFHFYVYKANNLNAFVAYGPRVYVDQGLIRFADSREELAGVLCHEMSHALHRDGSNDDKQEQAYDARARRLVALAEKPVGGHFQQHIAGLAQHGKVFVWMHHSRGEEERADLAGADLCAKANVNPWGMVWLLEKLHRTMGKGGISWFSDHPDTAKRIAELKRHFRKNPAVFAKFSSNEMSATPLWNGRV